MTFDLDLFCQWAGVTSVILSYKCALGLLLVGEAGVSWNTFHLFSNITENIYDIDFELTRHGRGILPLQTVLISYVVTSFVKTEYGINDTWPNCPNLPLHGVGWDSTGARRDSVKGVRFTGS